MAEILRRTHPLAPVIQRNRNALKKQLALQPDVQSGTAVLVGGTVSIATANIGANARITVTRNTPGGGIGNLSAPSASRVAGFPGTFVINSSDGTDVSTVDWEIVHQTGLHAHMDVSEVIVTAANGTDLATSMALLIQMMLIYEGSADSKGFPGHRKDDVLHKAIDAVNLLAVAASTVVDLATAQTAANDLKAKLNLHLAQAGVHFNNDVTNAVVVADANNLATLQTLVTSIKAKLNAHFGATMAPAGNQPAVRLVDA